MVACSESFLPASAVDDLRVIGARIDVEGAPGRANPSPEDEVQASILVIDQGSLPALTWSFLPCFPTATRIGVPICGTFIDGCDGCVGPQPGDQFALPVIGFQVRSEVEPDAADAREVLLQGVVCGEGSPSAEAIERIISGETNDLMPCEDDDGLPIEDEGRVVTVQIPIERDPENPNLNPEILDDIFLNESAWPPPYAEGVPRDEPSTGCLDGLSAAERAQLPVAGDPPLPIDFGVTGESLQTFTIEGQEFAEEIQVSWLADRGGFEVAFSFITQRPAVIRTQWRPPSDAPSDGRVVRFNFVVRDGRGGLDRVERGLCVRPAP
jgi:hypothetical protein